MLKKSLTGFLIKHCDDEETSITFVNGIGDEDIKEAYNLAFAYHEFMKNNY